MLDNLRLEIGGNNYVSDFVNDVAFLPQIQRDKELHSVIANFVPERLSFIKSAYNSLLIYQMSDNFFAHLSNEQTIICSFIK